MSWICHLQLNNTFLLFLLFKIFHHSRFNISSLIINITSSFHEMTVLYQTIVKDKERIRRQLLPAGNAIN
uniref:Uncharacterized protein n=1 Tax=Octopus bimaculoides TaxID=37653 RepID=A0A0L8H0R6_OCTBM